MNKMLQFFSENKDALTSIGILLTFLISSISLYFSVRNNKAVHYVNAVTQNRVEWLYKFREYISDLISTTTIDNVDKGMKDSDTYRKHISEIEKLRFLIHMHLNFSDEIDRNIDRCVEKLVFYYQGLRASYLRYYEKECYEKEFRQELEKYLINRSIWEEKLLRHVRVYLKFEWNRIKIEATGRIYKKNKQCEDLKKLYELYDGNNKKNHNERG